MKVRKTFNGTIQEAAAEVNKLTEAGVKVTAEVTLVVEMDGFTRVRERAKARTVAKPRRTKTVADEVAEPVN
jgi:hypothetical protein